MGNTFYNVRRFLRGSSWSLYYALKNRRSAATGVHEPERTSSLTVSMTSIQPRIHRVYLCIESLMDQTLKPNRIILWLSSDHFGYDNIEAATRTLPRSLTRLQKRGLNIRWTNDTRSYRKLVPTIREHPDHVIVTADDDTLYPRVWLENLYERHVQYPDCIICYRGKRMTKDAPDHLALYDDWSEFNTLEPSYNLFPTGKDGVLYPPNSLAPGILDEGAFTRLAPTNDDVWFKAMSLLQGTKCVKMTANHQSFPVIIGTTQSALFRTNVGEGKNNVYLDDIFRAYNLFELIES